jgi:hypothetical protein
VPSQTTRDRRGLRAVGVLEPFADPLVQSHPPTGRHPLYDGVGIQAVGEAVARDAAQAGGTGKPTERARDGMFGKV